MLINHHRISHVWNSEIHFILSTTIQWVFLFWSTDEEAQIHEHRLSSRHHLLYRHDPKMNGLVFQVAKSTLALNLFRLTRQPACHTPWYRGCLLLPLYPSKHIICCSVFCRRSFLQHVQQKLPRFENNMLDLGFENTLNWLLQLNCVFPYGI